MKCDHVYGTDPLIGIIDQDNYPEYPTTDFVKFTYCPYCKVQVHTIDGVPLGLPADYPEDDCIRGGCED